jgi:hypothetical protein
MPFTKGHSGNPDGRPPKSQALAEVMRAKLEEERQVIGKDGQKKKLKIKDIFTQKVINLALEGDMQAMKLIWNYIDGMPKQAIDLEASGDISIKVNIGGDID